MLWVVAIADCQEGPSAAIRFYLSSSRFRRSAFSARSFSDKALRSRLFSSSSWTRSAISSPAVVDFCACPAFPTALFFAVAVRTSFFRLLPLAGAASGVDLTSPACSVDFLRYARVDFTVVAGDTGTASATVFKPRFARRFLGFGVVGICA